jgi:branched-chain amino acid transport system permease protein
MSGSIYVLIALGMTLVLTVLGIVQLAHGEIYMMGGYFTYYFCVKLGLHYLLALAIATLLMALAGIVIEKVFYRPFRHASFLPTVILGLALMLSMQTTAVVTWGGATRIVTTPFPGVLHIGGASLSWERLVIIIISVVSFSGLFLLLYKTKIGHAMRAVSQDVNAALLQGISVDRVSSIAMFLGCGLAAVAGGLMGAVFTLSPFMGTPVLMKGIAIIILGGLGSLMGAVIGGFILGFVDAIATPLLSLQMANIIGFMTIIIVLLFRPQGIMGRPSP